MEDGHDRARAIRECNQEICNLHAMLQVKVNGRLIKREDRCLLRKSECDRNQLSLTRTQRAHITRRKVRRADAQKRRRRSLTIMCGWSARPRSMRQASERHQFVGTRRKGEGKICANHSNGARNGGAVQRADRLSAEDHLA